MRAFLSIILALLVPAAAGAMTSQTLIRYDFQSPGDASPLFENLPEQIAAGLDAGGWQLRDGTLGFAAGPGGIASDLAMLGRSWGTGGTPGNRFTLELSVISGKALQLDGFSFAEKASASGPTNWSFEVNGTGVAGGATAGGFVTRSGPLALGPLQGTVLLTLLAEGASSDNGSWRIDDFSLSGSLTTVPLPTSLLLLACALPLLGRRPRRG